MNTGSNEVADTAAATEALRPEVEQYRRELDECRRRMGELEQAEALLAGENRLLKMVASGRSLADILSALCRLIEELSEGALCGILLVDRASNRVGHVTGPSLPAEYNEAIRGVIIAPEAGPCGLAVCGKEQVIADVDSDTRWAGGWRPLALSHGLRACWSTPIFSSAGDVVGTFAIYWREPRSPSEQDQKIIGQTTHLASIAIERHRTEEELRRSEAYLAEAQRLSHTGSFGWNVSTGEIIWSKETYCILGYARAVKPTLDLVLNRVLPEDRALVQQTIDRATRDGTDLDFGHRLVMPDGVVKHVHVLAQPVKLGNGGLEFVGAIMDVTEKEKAEDALSMAKARFEGILEIAEDAIISTDSSQRIVLFNQGAEKVFGYAQDEIIGKPLDLLLPQRFAHARRGHIESFANSTDVLRTMGQRREVFGRRKDGGEFPAEASISKLDLGGEVVFTVILRDIAERKQAAEALHASEKLARGQVEALTRTLDALAMESVPDRLVEHVLRTIATQLGAHSCSVWQRDEASGVIDFQFSFEDGKFVTKSDSVLAGISLELPMEEFWPWPAVFRTGKPGLMEDIRELPFFPWQERLISLGVITILIVPMSLAGRVDAVIGIRFTQKRVFSADELELAQALANQAMLAMQLTRLSADSRESAVLAERNRMARDIHDTLAQGFTGVIMQLEAVKGAIAQNDLTEASDRVERAGDLARVGLGEARRSVLALRPRSLQDATLCMALDDLLKRMTNGGGLQAEFHLEGDEPTMPAEWEEGLLRVAQESLTNTIKHAKARNFRATLLVGPQEIQFRLVDDGSGFDLHTEHEGFGLLGMKERVDQMGGQFILRSMPGQGTEIQIILNNSPKQKPNGGGEHA